MKTFHADDSIIGVFAEACSSCTNDLAVRWHQEDVSRIDRTMTEDTTAVSADLIALVAEIVAAYVSSNSIPASELLRLIACTHAAIAGLSSGTSIEQLQDKPVPAVSIHKSVTPDVLICLEDGKKLKSLKRHLTTKYGMTPDAHRQKWKLPSDYPMVAPN